MAAKRNAVIPEHELVISSDKIEIFHQYYGMLLFAISLAIGFV